MSLTDSITAAMADAEERGGASDFPELLRDPDLPVGAWCTAVAIDHFTVDKPFGEIEVLRVCAAEGHDVPEPDPTRIRHLELVGTVLQRELGTEVSDGLPVERGTVLYVKHRGMVTSSKSGRAYRGWQVGKSAPTAESLALVEAAEKATTTSTPKPKASPAAPKSTGSDDPLADIPFTASR